MSTDGHVILLSSQIRMARAALDWTIKRLSEEAGISERTIRRLESPEGNPNTTVQTYASLVRAFERNNLMFISDEDDEFGPGVRLRSVNPWKKI